MPKKEHVALTKCYFCNEDSDILLATRYVNNEPVRDMAPFHGKVCSMRPCNKCEELMKRGVILITIDPAKSGENWDKPSEGHIPNPWRTGGWFVVSDDFVKRALGQDSTLCTHALKARWMFVEHAVAEQLGLFEVAKRMEENKPT